ncbi:hypothetical protein F5Y15DRAFT_6059 [Xylariaceae sp. FL0016]|nr:hypothetical protein F5Y15DRAFT_6059 [Xylariaceae sp. FL0016]
MVQVTTCPAHVEHYGHGDAYFNTEAHLPSGVPSDEAQHRFPNRPLSATTSQISLTGTRDYGMKFLPGADVMPATMAVPTHTSERDAQPQMQPQPQAPEAPSYHGPPPYGEVPHPEAYNRPQDGSLDEGDAGCHQFFVSWADILRGIALILTGSLKMPFVFLNGAAKFFWYIPVMYHDETVRKWPVITGFSSGCAYALQHLFLGVYDGLVGLVLLPVKGAKKEGLKGFFKGVGKGFGGLLLKPVYGGVALGGHFFYGIYKEVAKIKVIFKRGKEPRDKLESVV